MNRERTPRAFSAAPSLVVAALAAGLLACPGPGDREAGEEPEGTAGEAPGEMSPMETEAAFADDSARVLSGMTKDAMGGEDGWEDARYIAFRWNVERDGQVVSRRDHAWDRDTGRYRLSFQVEGQEYLALFDVDDVRVNEELGKVPVEGRAWIDGRELQGEERDSALARAYRAFINDTYWLLMPWKWNDPGVHARYDGRRALPDGKEYEVVHLSFDQGVGITNDQYWAFVDPETGRMAAWQFHLQNQEEPGPVIWWEDWRDLGPIQLSANRRFQQGETRIHFTELRASAEVPEGAFEPPATG